MSLTATKTLKAPTPIHSRILQRKRKFGTTSHALLRAYEIAFGRYPRHERRRMVRKAEREYPSGTGGRGNHRVRPGVEPEHGD